MEEQQAEQNPAQEAVENKAARAERGSGNMTLDAEKTRRRQVLELQRERILSERTSSPHRRSALANALASVEEELSQLGWMLHL